MKRNIFTALLLTIVALFLPMDVAASGTHDDAADGEKSSSIDAQGIIFDHLGDGYGWEMPFNHHKS
ncbi:MAG: hypothetical protein K2M71_11580, partial [Duncaniella sp.]|nr:hypothetical protein [Duncaniella sp.]